MTDPWRPNPQPPDPNEPPARHEPFPIDETPGGGLPSIGEEPPSNPPLFDPPWHDPVSAAEPPRAPLVPPTAWETSPAAVEPPIVPAPVPGSFSSPPPLEAPLPPPPGRSGGGRRWLWWTLGGCGLLLVCCLCAMLLAGVSLFFNVLNTSQRSAPIPELVNPLAPAAPRSGLDEAPAPAAPTAPSTGGSASPIGTVAPDFQLRTLTGETVKLSDFRGRPVVINFWASWCGPCKAEMPLLSKTYNELKDQGLVILAVDVQELEAVVEKYVKDNNLPFTILLDRNGEIANLYRARGLPTTYFVDPEGKVQSWQVGTLTQTTLRRHLDRIMR